MANSARFALERPRVLLVTMTLAVTYGVLSYLSMPRQENPSVGERFVSVTTYLPGAEPEKIELLVSKPLEDKISELEDLKELSAESSHGASRLWIEVQQGAPLQERMLQIRDKVQEARGLFPPGTSEPEVDTRVTRTNTLVLTLKGGFVSPVVLRREARELKRDLEVRSDVRRVEFRALPEEEIQVSVDMNRLSQRGISPTQVMDALAGRNIRLPSGQLDTGTLKSSIQTTGAYDDAADVASTYLGAGPDGLPILLDDVAEVRRGIAEPTMEVRAGGVNAVALGVEMFPRRDAIAFGERIRKMVAERELPAGMEISIAADESVYVEERLSLLTGSLLQGTLILVPVILFGLGWRSGVVVLLSIPISLTVAMGLLDLARVEIHQVAIVALVVAIGLVVDEAIVVTDSIERQIQRGLPPNEAAIQGLGEIHLAILAGAATTVAAFIPLMLLTGDEGAFVNSIPVVVSLMLVASVTVAHFFTPMFAAFVFRRFGVAGKSEVRHLPLEPSYRRALSWVMRKPKLTLGLFAVTLVASLVVARLHLWPPELFPDADRRQFLIELWLPVGSPLEETREVVKKIEAHLAREPDIKDWTAFIGSEAPKFYYNEYDQGSAEHLGMFIVNTQDDVPIDETPSVANRLRRHFRTTIAGADIRARPLRQGYLGEEYVDMWVFGNDLDTLRILTRRLADLVKQVEGTTDVNDSFGYDPVVLKARVDHAKANLLGITHLDIANTMRAAIDGATATTFFEGDQEIDIVVRLPESQRRSVTDLEALLLYSPISKRAVPLSQVATIEPGWTTGWVVRRDRKREARVRASIVPGYPLFTVAANVERVVEEQFTLPHGYEVQFEGQKADAEESLITLSKSGIVAIFLIYLVLVVRFRSLTQPLLIVLAIPMAVIGSSWALMASGYPFTFTAFLGVIAMIGVVVNDAIVLFDYINTLRGRGYGLDEAVAEGARTRLRAVIMTSVTTIGGLIPLSLRGGGFWSPFALAIIGGLAVSTVLTLLIEPAAYLILERLRKRTIVSPESNLDVKGHEADAVVVRG